MLVKNTVSLDQIEISTLLAGITMLSATKWDDRPDEVNYLLSNLGEDTPLDEDQLNALAERIAGGTV